MEKGELEPHHKALRRTTLGTQDILIGIFSCIVNRGVVEIDVDPERIAKALNRLQSEIDQLCQRLGVENHVATDRTETVLMELDQLHGGFISHGLDGGFRIWFVFDRSETNEHFELLPGEQADYEDLTDAFLRLCQ